jgi:hypothetical protein
VVFEGRLLRFAQDCREVYGGAVAAVEIEELSVTGYRDRLIEPPILGRGSSFAELGWAREGMHQIDAQLLGPGRWLACVDGNG